MTWPQHAYTGDPFGELPAQQFDARAVAVAIARSHAATADQETAYVLAWLRHPSCRRRKLTKLLPLLCTILECRGEPNRKPREQRMRLAITDDQVKEMRKYLRTQTPDIELDSDERVIEHIGRLYPGGVTAFVREVTSAA